MAVWIPARFPFQVTATKGPINRAQKKADSSPLFLDDGATVIPYCRAATIRQNLGIVTLPPALLPLSILSKNLSGDQTKNGRHKDANQIKVVDAVYIQNIRDDDQSSNNDANSQQ